MTNQPLPGVHDSDPDADVSPDVEALLRDLESAIAILETAGGEAHWIDWLRTDHTRIRARDARGLEHLMQAFGGMGSLNDVVLHAANANRGTEEELRAANVQLAICRTSIWERTGALLSEHRRTSAASRGDGVSPG